MCAGYLTPISLFVYKELSHTTLLANFFLVTSNGRTLAALPSAIACVLNSAGLI